MLSKESNKLTLTHTHTNSEGRWRPFWIEYPSFQKTAFRINYLPIAGWLSQLDIGFLGSEPRSFRCAQGRYFLVEMGFSRCCLFFFGRRGVWKINIWFSVLFLVFFGVLVWFMMVCCFFALAVKLGFWHSSGETFCSFQSLRILDVVLLDIGILKIRIERWLLERSLTGK